MLEPIQSNVAQRFKRHSDIYSKARPKRRRNRWLCFLMASIILIECSQLVKADDKLTSTTPAAESSTALPTAATLSNKTHTQAALNGSAADSLLLRLARHFPSGNELWDGIIRDCYAKPSFNCFQKNVYSYLDDALEMQDVNLTQRLKFYKNQVHYELPKTPTEQPSPTQHFPKGTRAARTLDTPAPESPIEEVTNALYGKSVKFAMTHDLELQLPELMFDGATFRISPRSLEGNGIIAKLELIPKQEVEARLAGKIIMKKIQKFLRSKLLLSFLALLLIIKIIKIKLFWLLPIIIGVGAAKKLLLKFLLFLFPALSHLFKLCSYYQQSYHTTKFHHHHHLINHHHTAVPPWHSAKEHYSGPELIYTDPPKGHPSAYLHGAPVHEIYGPGPGHEHFEGAWENSGPGLGSEYIGDINRVAQIEENSHYFKPHTGNDVHELHDWGLGTTQMYPNQRQQPSLQPQQKQQQPQQQQQQQRWPPTQQQRPPIALHPKQPQQQQQLQHQQIQQQQINYQKAHASSQSLNPFHSQDKQSSRPNTVFAQSAPSPVYVAAGGATPQANGGPGWTTAAQIAAQYEPARNNPQQQQQQQQQQLSPELAAQLKEAIRIQAEQRLIAQQQKILEHQPFVQDGQPLYPLNYDPFYSPILLKIDKIIEQLGIENDLCKERVVCSMYKDPASYTPHSNFISAELSRDTSELEPVNKTNEAVRRFYRLIQAARDGQDQKDCLSLYPQCNIPTK